MNLVIDIGNTRIKCALFHKNNLQELRFYNHFKDMMDDEFVTSKATQAILGSVVDGAEQWQQKLNKTIPTLLFTSSTKTPLANLYQSAATLGSDRLCASVASYYLHPNKAVLTIDAGTCIKYNFVNSHNQYLGGGISPGIAMRFKALNEFTSKLPLINFNENFNTLIGNTTENSILSGVLNGAIAEVDGVINEYKLQYPEILVLLTGGNSEYLAKRLKNSIFAHQNLVLKGLNHILNYNLELPQT